MADKKTNPGASVRDRLLNLARQRGVDFQLLLIRYVLERLLYRIGISEYREDFVLKGAMLHAVWLEDPFRNTRDLDLHARGSEDAGRITEAFRTIFAADVPDDGVTFDASALRAEPIRENVAYGGIRFTTSAALGGARVPIRIDVGFGDAITPEADIVEYPALLDFPKPHLLIYPRETVVAEKFHAMVALGLTNSRMKDFHDVAVLAANFDFNGEAVASALAATFKRRNTPLPEAPPPALTDAFTGRPDTIALWKAFVVREDVQGGFSDLDAVVSLVTDFLCSLSQAAATGKSFGFRWTAGGPWA
jgi:hypothetical protein